MRPFREVWPLIDELYDQQPKDIHEVISGAYADGLITAEEAFACVDFIQECDEEADE